MRIDNDGFGQYATTENFNDLLGFQTLYSQPSNIFSAVAKAISVWSNQDLTHFCDRASQFLLPHIQHYYPDARIVKLNPPDTNINFHEAIFFNDDKQVVDTQLSQFQKFMKFPDEFTQRFIYPRAEYIQALRLLETDIPLREELTK